MKRLLNICLVITLTSLGVGGFAQEYTPPTLTVEQLLERARINVADGNLDVAYFQYKDAVEKDPANKTALQGLVQTASLTGRFEEALGYSEKAAAAGVEASTLAVSDARALFGLQRFDEALARLDSAPADSADALELKGIILYQKKEFEAAKPALEQAEKVQPGRPAVLLYLGSLSALEGDTTKARSYLTPLTRLETGDYISGRALDIVNAFQVSGRPSGWTHWWTAALGYDSNVIGIGAGQALPSDISRKHAVFLNAGASGIWRSSIGNRTNYIGYDLNARVFEGLSDYNQELLRLYAGTQNRMDDRHSWSAQITADQFFLGEEHYLSSYSISPAIERRLTDSISGRLHLGFALNDYKFGVPLATLDRSGETFETGITLNISPRSHKTSWQVGYRYADVSADGADYDADANSLYIRMYNSSSERFLIELLAGADWWDYDNLNSRTAFTVRRNDTLTQLGATVYYVTQGSSIRPYASWAYYNNNSNIRLFDYNRSVLSVGVKSTF